MRRAGPTSGSSTKQSIVELLERRVLLALIPPSDPFALLSAQQPDVQLNRAIIRFTDNNLDESGYRVEFSEDGVAWPTSNYWDVPNTMYPSQGTVDAAQVLDTNPDYYYRVRAFDGTTFSDFSQIVSAQTPKDDSVMVEAVAGPSGITLSWFDPPGTIEHFIRRKARGSSQWQDTVLPPQPPAPTQPQTFTDTTALSGTAYEYAVVRHMDNGLEGGFNQLGYIFAGNQAPLVQDRGRVLLVVDQTIANDLTAELSLLKRDLIGDGWTVQRIEVPRVDIPRTNTNPDFTEYKAAVSYTKNVIRNVCIENPETLKAIFLIGHVPVPYSGYSARDGHIPGTGFDHRGAWPADAYYGEMNGLWTDEGANILGPLIINEDFPENSNRVGDGKFDHDLLPSDVEVAVGRVDFADMPTFYDHQHLLEIDLLKRYFRKNHDFRQGALTAQSRALVDDHWNEHYARNGWRNFAPLVGRNNTVSKNWAPTLDSERYLWNYGTGSGNLGEVYGIASLFDYAGRTSSPPEPPIPQVKKAIFNMIFGSYVGDWDKGNNFGRAVLGSESHALTYAWVGNTHWFLHPMGLGEPFAGSLVSTINTTPAGQPYPSPGTRQYQTQISLLGDPTLRMHVVKPVTNLRAQTLPETVGRYITWTHSGDYKTDGFVGYHVYRSVNPHGPFTKVTSNYITGNSYTDPYTQIGSHTYMVRAVKLQQSGGGTYYNASMGMTVQTTGPKVLLPKFNTELDQNITVQFDRNVSSVLTAGDLTLTQVGFDSFGANITLTNYNSATNTATFKFSGTFGSILPDGNYRATITASDVTINDEPMTEDLILDFHVLAGDANGDRTVNMTDYNVLAGNFGQTGKTFAQGNFDYDPAGNVNMADYNILAANFGAVINTPPSGPGEITVSVISPDQIETTWIDNVSGETGWRVQRSTDGSNFDWYTNLPANSTSFTATNLQDGRRYWWRVRAYTDPAGGSGETAYTPKKAGTTLLPAPTNLSVQLAGSFAASLSWSHSAQNALTAVIQRSTDGLNWTNIEQDATQLNYDDNYLNPITRYSYRVFLKNDLIESAPSYVEHIDTL